MDRVCRRSLRVGQCVLLAAALLACQKQPVARDGYAGEPVRAAINPDCSAELVDAAGEPCVQIDVFAEGEGEPAARGDGVTIHYILEVDGKPIDSSHGDKPLSFPLRSSNAVIDGMHRGVDGMRVGERRRFLVPPRLGYRGRKMDGIPPDANLVFFVELMDRRPGS